jgi:predicted SAM-dependent methyltransferase/uncharacterized protein YbaR (Trm112 family)
MDIKMQIERGILVSPISKKQLQFYDSEWLVTEDGQEKYQLIDRSIPVLLVDDSETKKYFEESIKMKEIYKEYEGGKTTKKFPSNPGNFLLNYRRDFRNKAAKQACQSIFENDNGDGLYLSLGGGPTRAYSQLVNVNIGPFPNVDVVADAHLLPYCDNVVDGIHCEAVLEHLRHPEQAIREMYRVLKPGKKVYVCTPFLQAYHGYPHHYQNFTLTGHQYLFSSNSFQILEAGTCVGPVHTMLSLTEIFIDQYMPKLIAKPVSLAWRLLARALYPLDKFVNVKDNAYILASTTYLVATKPLN